ncbi:hypothetical protein V1294_006394 [Bradyrhizobium sp. AZCC 1678]
MYQTIVDAMQALAESRSIFGLESSKDGEREFQLALGDKLEQIVDVH